PGRFTSLSAGNRKWSTLATALETLILKGVEAVCGRVRGKEAPPGFEPGVADLQSATPPTQRAAPPGTSGDGTPPLTGPLLGTPESGCEPVSATAPDLARVVEAWPTLPPAIRRAVLALIGPAD